MDEVPLVEILRLTMMLKQTQMGVDSQAMMLTLTRIERLIEKLAYFD